MKNLEIVFDSIVFDKSDKTFTIINGAIGTYSYKKVKRVFILNEDAKYKGKTEPFSHIVTYDRMIGILPWYDRKLYVGLKIQMADLSILALYISNNKRTINTFDYFEDRKQAEKIKKIFDKCISKYSVSKKEC